MCQEELRSAGLTRGGNDGPYRETRSRDGVDGLVWVDAGLVCRVRPRAAARRTSVKAAFRSLPKSAAG